MDTILERFEGILNNLQSGSNFRSNNNNRGRGGSRGGDRGGKSFFNSRSTPSPKTTDNSQRESRSDTRGRGGTQRGRGTLKKGFFAYRQDFCFYHQQFGRDATKCTKPCAWEDRPPKERSASAPRTSNAASTSSNKADSTRPPSVASTNGDTLN